MPYFDRMYQAAISRDDVTLNALLTQGACIDEREKSEAFTTVAGKLASLGKLEQALHLVNKFGAGPEFVIHALLKAGKTDEADALNQEYGIDLLATYFTDLIPTNNFYRDLEAKITQRRLQILAHAGDMKSLEQELESVDFNNFEMILTSALESAYAVTKKSILRYAGQGGHLSFLQQTYRQLGYLPEYTTYALVGCSGEGGFGHNSLRFATPELARHSLAFLDNYFRDYLVKLLTQEDLGYDIGPIAEEAKKIRIIMDDFDLDYAAACKCALSKNPAEAVKTAQLIQALNVEETQAKIILKNQGARHWFFREKKLMDTKLPHDITHSINEFVVGNSLKRNLDSGSQELAQLKKLSRSRLFSKPKEEKKDLPSVTRSGRRYKPY